MPCCTCVPCNEYFPPANVSRIFGCKEGDDCYSPNLISKSGNSSPEEIAMVHNIISSQSQCGVCLALMGIIGQSPCCLMLAFCCTYSSNKRVTQELAKIGKKYEACICCGAYFFVHVKDPEPMTATASIIQMVPGGFPPNAAGPANFVAVIPQPHEYSHNRVQPI